MMNRDVFATFALSIITDPHTDDLLIMRRIMTMTIGKLVSEWISLKETTG